MSIFDCGNAFVAGIVRIGSQVQGCRKCPLYFGVNGVGVLVDFANVFQRES